jgi:hypothetical protein
MRKAFNFDLWGNAVKSYSLVLRGCSIAARRTFLRNCEASLHNFCKPKRAGLRKRKAFDV